MFLLQRVEIRSSKVSSREAWFLYNFHSTVVSTRPGTRCHAKGSAAAAAAPPCHLTWNGPIHTSGAARVQTCRRAGMQTNTPEPAFPPSANRFTFCAPASALTGLASRNHGVMLKAGQSCYRSYYTLAMCAYLKEHISIVQRLVSSLAAPRNG
jgi:hypothetical protein